MNAKVMPNINMVEKVAKSTKVGFLYKKSLTGYWYKVWFTLKGSALHCFERQVCLCICICVCIYIYVCVYMCMYMYMYV